RVFPRVADVGIVRDGDDHAPVIVVYAAPVRPLAVVGIPGGGGDLVPEPQVRLTGDLQLLLDVIHRMEDRIVVRNLADFFLRERAGFLSPGRGVGFATGTPATRRCRADRPP